MTRRGLKSWGAQGMGIGARLPTHLYEEPRRAGPENMLSRWKRRVNGYSGRVARPPATTRKPLRQGQGAELKREAFIDHGPPLSGVACFGLPSSTAIKVPAKSRGGQRPRGWAKGWRMVSRPPRAAVAEGASGAPSGDEQALRL